MIIRFGLFKCLQKVKMSVQTIYVIPNQSLLPKLWISMATYSLCMPNYGLCMHGLWTIYVIPLIYVTGTIYMMQTNLCTWNYLCDTNQSMYAKLSLLCKLFNLCKSNYLFYANYLFYVRQTFSSVFIVRKAFHGFRERFFLCKVT